MVVLGVIRPGSLSACTSQFRSMLWTLELKYTFQEKNYRFFISRPGLLESVPFRTGQNLNYGTNYTLSKFVVQSFSSSHPRAVTAKC